MARRKKHPRLPNGYGSIKYLGKNRRNPYGVYPPVKEYDLDGKAIAQPAICYVDDWTKGFAVLTAYHAGTYTPGMECDLGAGEEASLISLSGRILADYNRSKGITAKKGKTFKEVYAEFYRWKYEGSKEYSEASKNSSRAAFRNCSALHDRVFDELRYKDLQDVVDNCTLKHASLELIVSLFKQMYKYADIHEYVAKNYAEHVAITKSDDDEHGVPFSPDELELLWEHKEDPIAEMILIMCYSGYRISAYKTLEVNIKEKYFRGGVKTQSGKGRIVPIHSAILPLVIRRISRIGHILPFSTSKFRSEMHTFIKSKGMVSHTPHDCRHTFSMLCEKYGVNENDRKRMLGHKFGDITNDVYGHREMEDLRKEIEKIKAP